MGITPNIYVIVNLLITFISITFLKKSGKLRLIKVSGETDEVHQYMGNTPVLFDIRNPCKHFHRATHPCMEFTGIKSDQHMGNTPYSEYILSENSENHRNQPQ
jgi:hypothetical protein